METRMRKKLPASPNFIVVKIHKKVKEKLIGKWSKKCDAKWFFYLLQKKGASFWTFNNVTQSFVIWAEKRKGKKWEKQRRNCNLKMRYIQLDNCRKMAKLTAFVYGEELKNTKKTLRQNSAKKRLPSLSCETEAAAAVLPFTFKIKLFFASNWNYYVTFIL